MDDIHDSRTFGRAFRLPGPIRAHHLDEPAQRPLLACCSMPGGRQERASSPDCIASLLIAGTVDVVRGCSDPRRFRTLVLR